MMSDLTANLQKIASNAKAWPFAEARALASRLDKMGNAKDEVLFETGYGPSGLPHIGTFGEVVRTTMVRHAFESLTGRKTRLICFSDDMDGFRKIPDNVPNHEMLAAYLHMPLTKVKDPFGTAPSPLVLGACGGGSLEGEEVTITGALIGIEETLMNEAFDSFTEEPGIIVS